MNCEEVKKMGNAKRKAAVKAALKAELGYEPDEHDLVFFLEYHRNAISVIISAITAFAVNLLMSLLR